MTADLKNGDISTKLDSQIQSRYFEGSSRYTKAVKAGQDVSTLSITEKQAGEIII